MTSVTINERVSFEGGTTLSIQLYVSDCRACGVIFGMTQDLERRRRADGGTVYCPNGHTMTFGESEAERLRKQNKRLEEDVSWYADRATSLRQEVTTTKRRLSATKGVLTKTKKRAAAGQCPFGCRRHFVNLERHVASKHPEEKLA